MAIPCPMYQDIQISNATAGIYRSPHQNIAPISFYKFSNITQILHTETVSMLNVNIG